jgi:hypothetical protein
MCIMSKNYAIEPVEPIWQQPRHAELKLRIDTATERDLKKDLEDVADELCFFAPPSIRERTIDGLQLITSPGTALPPRYNLLHYASTEFKSGTHKTKLTLPGRTFRLEGTQEDSLGIWRSHIGETEGALLDHEAMIDYLRPLLPANDALTALFDSSAPISNQAMREALWQDASSQTTAWADANVYEASKYVSAPIDVSQAGNNHNTTEYTSSVSSVLRVINTPTNSQYRLRIGTELPMTVRSTFDNDSLDQLEKTASQPLIDGGSKELVEIYQEYRLSFEKSHTSERVSRALAVMALESHDLTANGLELLALSTGHESQERRRLAKMYRQAMKTIYDAHLASTQLQ